MAHFEIYLDESSLYRWRSRAANGRIIADPGEEYKAQRDCEHGIELLRQHAAGARVDQPTEAGKG